MSNNERLPIQVVVPRENDYTANTAGGSQTPLCLYTDEIRVNIENQCINLNQDLETYFKTYPTTPCIAKVIMKDKAIAKSHKPTAIFKAETCPIVGTEKLNEVLIKVTPKGLQHLINTVKAASTQAVRNSLTKIESIESYREEDKIEIYEFKEYEQLNQPIKIKLFSFDDSADNEYYIHGFDHLLKDLQISHLASRVYYGGNSIIYKLNCFDKNIVEKMVKYPGVHKISFFPQYVCDPPNLVAAQKHIDSLEPPSDGKDYPIIGLIDSGISKNNPYLMPWVYEKVEFVPPEYQNNEHGTFVAGVIEYGNILNGVSKNQQHFKLLDVVIFPNNDPSKGNTDVLTEDTLINNLHDVIGKYCDKVKVWNMSLGTSKLCNDIISDLAVALDEIQDLYGIDIIISAGNYEDVPLREWPPVLNRHDEDRITVPADSVRAITVGSIANTGIPGFVEIDRPSPFSRKGPGANYLIKPEIVYEGGNCTSLGDSTGTGIISLDVNGNLVEGIGTSYSTPSISALFATLRYSVEENEAREYAKAFLIHSCSVPSKARKEECEYSKYYGYGKPAQTLEDILSCSNSSVTLIFKGELYDGSFIEFNDFPFPKSLIKNGKCYGEIKMTLAYTPQLNVNYGQEYCRANIDAHLGTYSSIGDEGNVIGFKGEVPLEKKWDKKYEASRVENGFKWNPIKSYSRSLKKGIKEMPWRLKVDCCARLGENYSGQKFVLLVTITDPNNHDIYSEVIQMLRERGFIYNNLKLQNQIRQSIGFGI